MSLSELLPSVQALGRIEKIQLFELLAQELGNAKEPVPFQPFGAYPVWTPLEAYEAAAQLQQFIENERSST